MSNKTIIYESDKEYLSKLPTESDYELFCEIAGIYEFDAYMSRELASSFAVMDIHMLYTNKAIENTKKVRSVEQTALNF